MFYFAMCMFLITAGIVVLANKLSDFYKREEQLEKENKQATVIRGKIFDCKAHWSRLTDGYISHESQVQCRKRWAQVAVEAKKLPNVYEDKRFADIAEFLKEYQNFDNKIKAHNAAFLGRENANINDRAEVIRKKILDCKAHWSRLTDSFISHSAQLQCKKQWAEVAEEAMSLPNVYGDKRFADIAKFLNDYHNLKNNVKAHNIAFVENEKRECKELLSDIEGKSLDDQQQTIVVSDEDHTLVLAGAGSGKTLTIAGKVRYLCERKGVAPEDILLLAFNSSAKAEMEERISTKMNINIEVRTFHSLGLRIVNQASEQPVKVEEDKLHGIIADYLSKDVMKTPKMMDRLITYFAYYMQIPKIMLDDNPVIGDIFSYDKGMDLETLRSKYERATGLRLNAEKEKVKSLEELTIANFFYLHGIRYEYERPYPYQSDNREYKQYQPDFYLSDYDIYLEHFGIDRNGDTPQYSATEADKYRKGMEWKRRWHMLHQTQLLETYSYYSREGTLEDNLEKLMKSNGVQFKMVDTSEVYSAIWSCRKADNLMLDFRKLCETFITLFKNNGYVVSDLDRLIPKEKKFFGRFFDSRRKVFFDIIRPIMEKYESYLQENHIIDFADMINHATALVAAGTPIHRFKYIIIDEFQDISVARYKLVKAILNQTHAKLLCVGDDWQSIYRFTGSDISIFTEFEKYFGYSDILKIEKTYRNSQELIDITKSFILKNKKQCVKNPRSDRHLQMPLVFEFYQRDCADKLADILERIAVESGPASSVMLLGRNNSDIKHYSSSKFRIKKVARDETVKSITYLNHPNMKIHFRTVHKSKGLEADNIVLLNFKNATTGFPNTMTDDPLIQLVLNISEEIEHAEERRLLYVALTRTKNRAYVLVDKKNQSVFLKEFRNVPGVEMSSNHDRMKDCSQFPSGALVSPRIRNYGTTFAERSNNPLCQNKDKPPERSRGSAQSQNTSDSVTNRYTESANTFTYIQTVPFEFYSTLIGEYSNSKSQYNEKCPKCGGVLRRRASAEGSYVKCQQCEFVELIDVR